MEHFTFEVKFLQLGHFLLTIWTNTGPCFAASKRSLCVPPARDTGKRTCTRGFISLCLAFSGLPMRPPTKVGALSLICTPESQTNCSQYIRSRNDNQLFLYHCNQDNKPKRQRLDLQAKPCYQQAYVAPEFA